MVKQVAGDEDKRRRSGQKYPSMKEEYLKEEEREGGRERERE